MKIKTGKISIEHEEIDLNAFYDYCSALPDLKGSPKNSRNIIKEAVSDQLKEGLKNFCQKLLYLIKNAHASFQPGLIEMSLYDPKDRLGNRFFSLFMADREEAITAYLNGMDINLSYKSTKDEGRGPIIPSEKLHSSVYYADTFQGKKAIYFKGIGDEATFIYVGRFVNTAFRPAEENTEDLDLHIRNFFQDVWENCLPKLADPQGQQVFNLALLIPLFRPAAKFKGEEKNIYNGGGIFLFGYLKKPELENNLVLELQSYLTKSLFKVSHAQIALDEVETFRNIYTSLIIHQVKNKLASQVSEELGRILNRYPFPSEVKGKLQDVKNAASAMTNAFTFYLNNLAYTLSKKDDQIVCPENFKLLEEKLQKKTRNALTIHVAGGSTGCFKGRLEIIQMLLEELIENAEKYYLDNKEVRTGGVDIYWVEEHAKEEIEIRVLSRGTKMDKSLLPVFGTGPQGDTNSTGLGGFFINRILEVADAKRFPDERFFKISNERDGVLFVMAFYPIAENK